MTASAILDRHGRPFPKVERTADLRDLSAGAPREVTRRRLNATYDSAQTTSENRNYWAAADALDSDTANSLAVRKRTRERARYEVGNDGYARGIVHTLADHTVGTGPTLQVLSGSPGFNSLIEGRWMEWAEAIGLTEKLRTLVMARATDGEAFGLLVTNPDLASPVTLDFRLVECDHFSGSPLAGYGGLISPNYIDGVWLDDLGNPVSYDVLRYHPGAMLGLGMEYRTIPARYVIHLFRCDRPQQHRGLTEFGPVLQLFPMLRRYTLAELRAAETAADIALVLETDLPPDATQVQPTGEAAIPRGSMVANPMGWKTKQVAAEHPAPPYEMFKREVLGELGRPWAMPPTLVSLNSSASNFSSSRLDCQPYFAARRVDQNQIGRVVMGPLFRAWFAEARRYFGFVWSQDGPPPFDFRWPGVPYFEPEVEANAITARLRAGITNRDIECARQNLDCEDVDITAAASYGMTVEAYRALLVQSIFFGGRPPAA